MKGKYLSFVQANLEAERWKKVLNLMEEENVAQKNRLSQMLKDRPKKKRNLLELAAQYQSQFLQQDESFKIMWNNLARLEGSINQQLLRADHDKLQITNQHAKFKEDIEDLQAHFDQLKSDFLSFSQAFSNSEAEQLPAHLT